MAILQQYVGPWELNEGQRNALLHHRATGKERSAGAYNPRLLVAPVKKAKVIWEEWIAAETQKVQNRHAPWIWSRISKATMRFEGELKAHVMVPVGTARRLAKASASPPMNLSMDGMVWEPMCDHLPARTPRAPLMQIQAPQKHLICVNCWKRSDWYIPNFSTVYQNSVRHK
jgi:hypothetical protein